MRVPLRVCFNSLCVLIMTETGPTNRLNGGEWNYACVYTRYVQLCAVGVYLWCRRHASAPLLRVLCLLVRVVYLVAPGGVIDGR